jgi:hypothetical protein
MRIGQGLPIITANRKLAAERMGYRQTIFIAPGEIFIQNLHPRTGQPGKDEA